MMQFICIITGFLLSTVVVFCPSSVLTIILYKTILLYYPTLDLCFLVMRGSHPTTRYNHRIYEIYISYNLWYNHHHIIPLTRAYCLGIFAARLLVSSLFCGKDVLL